MRKPLGRLTRLSLRDAWRHESGEFTPWLAEPENLALLAEALGLEDLVCVATETQVGDFKVDLLCTDGADQVIIENQLAPTNHGHLGQILTYAAGVGAKKVIWIAESFRPEHAAALQFLNENTSEDLGFFGVQVELWQIGDSPPAPKFEVVVEPNDWVRAGREQARAAADASPGRRLQQGFWTALVEKAAKEAPKIRLGTPRPRPWFRCPLPRVGFAWSVRIHGRDSSLDVGLVIRGTDAARHFAALAARRAEIERGLGFDLEWQESPDAGRYRLASTLEDAPLEDESRWGEYLDWIVRRLAKMDEVLRPVVMSLP